MSIQNRKFCRKNKLLQIRDQELLLHSIARLNLCLLIAQALSYDISLMLTIGRRWSGGAMILGKFQCRGRPTIWMIVGQGSIALAVGAGGGCLDIFTLLYLFSSLSPSLWETARYRLKHCLKGSLNSKQAPNQSLWGYALRYKKTHKRMSILYQYIHKSCKITTHHRILETFLNCARQVYFPLKLTAHICW